jgi:hypothetical protein
MVCFKKIKHDLKKLKESAGNWCYLNIPDLRDCHGTGIFYYGTIFWVAYLLVFLYLNVINGGI